jgi:hypothetical protein
MNVSRFSLSVLLSSALALTACHSANNQQANQQNPGDQQQQAAANAPAQPANSNSTPQSGAQGTAPQQAQAPTPPPPPPVIELPAGTQVRVRLDQGLSSKTSQPGDTFSASVADDVMVDGKVVVPRGSRADGTVIDAKPLGRFKGGALLSIKIERVHTRWGSYPVETGTIARAEKGKGKRSATFIGGGAGLGALIGGLAGGGKGAAFGALAGGGAGTAGSAFTGNQQIVLPAETLLTFRLQHSVRVTERGRDPQDPQLQSR